MIIQIGITAFIGLLFSASLGIIQLGELNLWSMFVGYQIGAFVPVMAAITSTSSVKEA